jgi:predicted transcriptional regulator
MSAPPRPASGSVTVRLPVELLRQLDALCALTERTRTYWVTKALAEVIPSELMEAQIVADEFAAIEARPDEGLPNEQVDEWMIENGLTTREALEHARERARKAHGTAPP